MKKTDRHGLAAGLLVAWLAAGLALAGGSAKLDILTSPELPPAKVWIDGKAQEQTPLSLPYVSAGQHTLRVSRQGAAIERSVYLKSGSSVVLVVDFLNNDIKAPNVAELGYDPVRDKSRVVLTSTRYEPTIPAAEPGAEPKPEPTPPSRTDAKPQPATPAPPKTAMKAEAGMMPVPKPPPEPAPKPEPSSTAPPTPGPDEPQPKPGPQPAEPAVKPPAAEKPSALEPPSPSPGDTAWSPLPREGTIGPPRPPTIKPTPEPAPEEEAATPIPEVKPTAGQTPKPAPPPIREEPVAAPPVPEKPAPEIPAEQVPAASTSAAPCPRSMGAVSCDAYGNGIQDTIHKYYCLLTNQDFDQAFRMRATDKDLAWFYTMSKTFCGIHDFWISEFEVQSADESEAAVSYFVDLKDAQGRVIETWKMRVTLTRRSGAWKIRSTVGGLVTH